MDNILNNFNMDKSTKNHLDQINLKNFTEWQKEVFTSFTSSTNNGKHITLHNLKKY